MRKPLAVLGVTASALAVGLLTASPAAAVTNTTEFDLIFPDSRPETRYTVDNEARVVSGRITVYGVTYWNNAYDVVNTSKRFTSFKVTNRLESRLGQDGADVVEASKTCDLTSVVNANEAYWMRDANNSCSALATIYDGEVWWSSDSTVVYDVEGDGKGAITVETLGSPLLHG